MKNQEVKSTNEKSFSNAVALIMPRNNGTQAGINALAESLKRGLK